MRIAYSTKTQDLGSPLLRGPVASPSGEASPGPTAGQALPLAAPLHGSGAAPCAVPAPPSSGSAPAGGSGSALVDTQKLLPSSNHAGSQPSRTIEKINPETGEVTEYEPSENGKLVRRYSITDHQNTRGERWAMKWAVDRLLKGSRQFKCHRWRIPGRDLEVKLSLEHLKSFYAGFECCGSVWGCPLCAPKITERRRVEVQAAIEEAKAKGWNVYLGTYTVRHGMGDDPKVIRKLMSKAWMKGSSTRAGSKMRKMIGLKGTIRVLETTYGENGWHPHYHVLLITDSNLSPEDVQALWYPVWLDGCRKVGLPEPSMAHGVQVDDGSRAAKYVTKWGMDSELTKGHLKKGKRSVNPWDLLRVHTFGLDHQAIALELREVMQGLGIDKEKAGALWLVFFRSFKGARQLYWSNGLRKLLGLQKEATDQELAEKEMDTVAAVLATLTDAQRFDLIRTKSLPKLLNLAEDAPGLIPEFLESIQKPKKDWSRPDERRRRAQRGRAASEERGARKSTSVDTPDVTPDVSPDVTPDVTPDVSPDVTPDVSPDVSPSGTLEIQCHRSSN